jgi:hypothetical protein
VCAAFCALHSAKKAEASGNTRAKGTSVSTGDAQLGFPSRGDALHAPFDFVDGDQQAATVVEQQAAGRSETGAMAAAVEQQDVQVVLEFAHRVGDGGRDAIEFDGGCGKTAASVDGVENGERLERECHRSIFNKSE